MTRTQRHQPDSIGRPTDGLVAGGQAPAAGARNGVACADAAALNTMMVALATIASTLTTTGKPFVMVKHGAEPATAVFPQSSSDPHPAHGTITFSLERQPALVERLGRGEHVVLDRPCVVLFPIVHRPDVVFLLCVALGEGQELASREIQLLQVLCHLAAPLMGPDPGRVEAPGKPARRVHARLEKRAAQLEARVRRLERAKRDVEAIDHQMRSLLLSNIAHELRTPLVAIRGYTKMILEGRAGEINDTQRRYLSVVEENIDRVVSLSGNMARLTARQQLRTEALDLCALLKACVGAIKVPCAQKDIQLASLIPPGRFELIGDREKLGQVLDSLLLNALRYTPPGGNIRVEFHRGMQGEATIKVSDTGVGIPKELADKLFDSAGQTDLPNSIGHGLSLVHDIICLHGGRISVSSRTGKGSTFAITLPAIKVDTGQAG